MNLVHVDPLTLSCSSVVPPFIQDFEEGHEEEANDENSIFQEFKVHSQPL